MATTGRRPSRWVSQPKTGAKANIPAMCALRTSPTSRSVCAASCPALRMCTGVMVITPTITTCPIAMALTPSRAAGRDRITGSAARTPTPASAAGGRGRRVGQVWRDHGRVRAQQCEQHERREPEQQGREDEGSRQRGDAVAVQRRAGGCREARADDRASVVAHTTSGECRAPGAHRSRGPPRRSAPGIPPPSRSRRGRGRRTAGDRAAHRGGQRQERSDRREGVACREARPAAAALHDVGAGTAKRAAPTTVALWATPERPTPARSAASSAATEPPTASRRHR